MRSQYTLILSAALAVCSRLPATSAAVCNGAGVAGKKLTVSGMCSTQLQLNTIFTSQGFTAASKEYAGREYFVDASGTNYLFHEADCTGNGNVAGMWVFDNTKPSTTTTKVLTGDGGSCILYGYVFSSSQVPPKSSAWQLYCGTAYVTVPLTIETSCICKVGFAGDECEDASAATCNSEGADVKSLVVAGACDRQSRLNTAFLLKGTSADGREYFANSDESQYLYYDSDCSGGNEFSSSWIFGKAVPSTLKDNDLAGDGETCSLRAYVPLDEFDAQALPANHPAWRMYCTPEGGNADSAGVKVAVPLTITIVCKTTALTTTTPTTTSTEVTIVTWIYPLNVLPITSIGANVGQKTATVHQGASLGPGRVKGTKALQLDGVGTSGRDGQHVSIDGGITVGGNAFTACAWTKWAKFGDHSRVIDLGDGAGSDNILIYNNQGGNTLMWNILHGNTQNLFEVGNKLRLNTWTHVCGTVDSSGTMALLVNGVEQKCTSGRACETSTGKGTKGWKPNRLPRSRAYIGRSNWADDTYFAGSISDVTLIDGKAVTAAEVFVMMRATDPTTTTATTTVTMTTLTTTRTTLTTTKTSSTGTAAMISTTKTIRYDPGNVDCVEMQGKCTRACENANERNHKIIIPQNKKGKACIGPTDCVPGEGACPTTSTTSTTTATAATPAATSSASVSRTSTGTPTTTGTFSAGIPTDEASIKKVVGEGGITLAAKIDASATTTLPPSSANAKGEAVGVVDTDTSTLTNGAVVGIVVGCLVLLGVGIFAAVYHQKTGNEPANEAGIAEIKEAEARRNTMAMETNPLAAAAATRGGLYRDGGASTAVTTVANPTFTIPPTSAEYSETNPRQPGIYDQGKAKKRSKGSVTAGKPSACARGQASGGRKCYMAAQEGSLYCKAHSCGKVGCSKSKSNKDRMCAAHANSTAAVEYAEPIDLRGSRGGLSNKEPILRLDADNYVYDSSNNKPVGNGYATIVEYEELIANQQLARGGRNTKEPILRLDADNYVYDSSNNKPRNTDYAVPLEEYVVDTVA